MLLELTRASRHSLLTSMSAAFTGLAMSAIARRPCGDSRVSDCVTRLTVDDFAAHLTICIQQVPDRRRSSAITTAVRARKTCLLSEPLLCQLFHPQHRIHDICDNEVHPNLCRRDTEVQIANTVLSESACPLAPTSFIRDSSWITGPSAPN